MEGVRREGVRREGTFVFICVQFEMCTCVFVLCVTV